MKKTVGQSEEKNQVRSSAGRFPSKKGVCLEECQVGFLLQHKIHFHVSPHIVMSCFPIYDQISSSISPSQIFSSSLIELFKSRAISSLKDVDKVKGHAMLNAYIRDFELVQPSLICNQCGHKLHENTQPCPSP